MKTSKSFAEQLIIYQSNVLPQLLEKLSEQLHVSINALQALEIGYCLHNNCWVFPERDASADIIGLSFRQWDDRKYMAAGSKRGLTFVPNVHRSSIQKDRYQAGPQNWERASDEYPCAICGSHDGCMNSSENPNDPKAVMCCRISKESEKEIGGGFYLHILKPEGYLTQAGPILMDSGGPVVIVEGATDVAAALDLGLVAIGKPSNIGCIDKVAELVAGLNVVVMGENDAGAGREGMEQTFEALQPVARSAVKMLPPDGVKDLRSWFVQGLTKDNFLHLARTEGDSKSDGNQLTSIAPLDLARLWIEEFYKNEDIYTLRVFHGNWYAYIDQCYREIDRAALRQQLYRYFGEKKWRQPKGAGFTVVPYDPTKKKLDDIMDALLAFCPITSEEIPCWLDLDHFTSNPKHILVFPNGYLDMGEYIYNDSEFKLQESTPKFFSLSRYPYEFDVNASYNLWTKFLNEIFADDPAKILLLQEWFGYNLVPDNSHEKFMLLLGPTRAGKGTILDVLANILGEDQVIATSFKDYTRRFAMFPFLGKLAALIGDVSVGSNYDGTEALNLLKRITGNDVTMIERKGKDITQACVKLYTRFTMAANVMPRLPDFARTIESRMLVLQFMISFMGREDTLLKTKLKAEAPGILVWSLEGLRRLKKNKEFTMPVGHAQVLNRVRNEITPLTEFVSDWCLLGKGKDYYITIEHLYECWKNWAIQNGERMNSTRWLSRSILSLYPECRLIRRIVNSTRIRVIAGLRIRPEILARLGFPQ